LLLHFPLLNFRVRLRAFEKNSTGGRQDLRPLVHDERYGLPDIGVCVQGDLKAVIYGQASRVVQTTFFGYEAV
jgi:hypothetical protein